MFVALVNGSPHPQGCTYTALTEIAKVLKENRIDSRIFNIGHDIKGSCLGCGKCRETRRCVMDDAVNRFIPIAQAADGFVFGSPVHYAAPTGDLLSFMSRLAFSSGRYLANKPAASIVSCRRGGATGALDTMNKFYPINGMFMVPSQYWNMVHGNTPEEVLQDAEGLQIMRNLALKMAWFLNCSAQSRLIGIRPPVLDEPRQTTNFIR